MTFILIQLYFYKIILVGTCLGKEVLNLNDSDSNNDFGQDNELNCLSFLYILTKATFFLFKKKKKMFLYKTKQHFPYLMVEDILHFQKAETFLFYALLKLGMATEQV